MGNKDINKDTLKKDADKNPADDTMDKVNQGMDNEDSCSEGGVSNEPEADIPVEEASEQESGSKVTDINDRLETKKLKEKLDELNDRYLRLQAEYANYRRRTNEERETIGLFANEKIITDLLGVIDNMERALESFEDKNGPSYEGVALVYKQLIDSLEKFGLELIEAEGADFDPNLHMAVMQVEVEGMESNKVANVLQKGYKLGDKVIRPTMVQVSE